jgi:hypothetical protein
MAKARYDTMYFVPAPQGVKIDGDLPDWDKSGELDSYVTPDTREMRRMKFYGMYDSQALYLGGDITHATPMMNMHDPAVNAGQPRDADSAQFRFFLKPVFPGPSSSFEPRKDLAPVAHLTLWYFTPKRQANLQILTGWDFAPRAGWKDGVAPASAFQAAYQKRTDGSGYSFESHIRWKSISDELRLKANDETAATVQCCWGTPDGRLIWGLWTVATDREVALGRGLPPKGRAWGCTRWVGMGGEFTAVVSLPLDVLGLALKSGQTIRLDLGFRLGDDNGQRSGERIYWSNRSPLSRIIYDVPSEIRMELAHWAQARVE